MAIYERARSAGLASVILAALVCGCGDETGGRTGGRPRITVMSPNGGEVWTAGATQAVIWTTKGNVGNVQILLSTDGGLTWPVVLAAVTPNDGAELVTVPDAPSAACRVCVIELDGNPGDVSDFNFTIVSITPFPGAFNLLTPVDATTDVALAPTLDWEDSADADTYALLVDDDPGFGSPNVSEPLLVASGFAVTAPLTPDTTFYWQVTASNTAGDTPASNNDFQFTTVPWDGFWKVDIDAPALGDGLTWATAFQHPQYAVDAAFAAGGGEVWVAEGTYERLTGSDTVALTMADNVHIYGGFKGIGVEEAARGQRDPKANETILDGDDDDDLVGNVYHVVVGASNATLDGFTVTRGNANGSTNYVTNCGGGVYNSSVANIVIRDCVIANNSADMNGGGINNDSTSSVAITGCVFRGNSAVNASGGGLCNEWGSSPSVSNCVFVWNSAGSSGGAIDNHHGSSPILANCVFYANSATINGGAVSNIDSSSSTLVNCTAWANTAPTGSQIFNNASSSCTVSYSDIQSGYAGPNINADPLFVNPDDPDGPDDIWGTADDGLRLRSGSPCIDAADTGAAPALDILGNARHDDCQTPDTGIGGPPVADMGAYEFQSTSAGLQVTYPNGGEVLTRGQPWQITWNQTGLGGNVKIEIGHVGTDPVAMPEGEWTGSISTGAACPTARLHHTAVWSGTRMIVWGGTDPGESNTGAIYDPATDTWESATSTGGANPTPRHGHSAVWTGTHMVVWGGDEGPVNVNTGASYCLATDSWDSTTSTGAGCLGIRQLHSAVWTDAGMIVWGGNNSGGLDTGATYDPLGDLWGPATSTGGQCPAARDEHSAVWSGTRMIVWGGFAVPAGNTDTGAVYDPVTNTWVSTTSTAGLCPAPRQGHSAAWTGSYMVVWDGSVLDNTGAIYNPKTDTWEYVVSAGAGVPSPRGGHTAIWTGTRMVLWGGTGPTNTGAYYNPPGWHVLTVVAESAPDSGSFTVPASVTKDIWVGDEYRVRVTHLTNSATDDSDADFAISAGGGPGVWHVNSHVAASGDGATWLTAMQTPQEAVDAAEAAGGGEVWVQAGTYDNTVNGGGTNSVLVMKDGVHVFGGFAGWESARAERVLLPGRRDSVLDGENTAYHVVVGASNATLEGFVVMRGNAGGAGNDGVGGGILCLSLSDAVVANCSIFANVSTASNGGGMYVGSTSAMSVVACTFAGNSAVHGGGLSTASAEVQIVNCVFSSNTADSGFGVGGGIHAWDASVIDVRNCALVGNTASTSDGINAGNGSSYVVTNTIFRNGGTDEIGTNGGGATFDVAYSNVQGGYAGPNISSDPLFVDPDGPDDIPGNADDDFRLTLASPCIDTGTIIGAPSTDIEGTLRPSGGGVDMGAYERRAGTVYYVDDDRPDDTGDGLTWATAKRTVQAANALAVADAGDELWVAEGTYTNGGGGSTATVLVMKDGTGYYGGFAGTEADRSARDPGTNVTTLDGLDTAYHVVEGASRATLDGFTVTRGNATGSVPNESGGGMYNIGTSPVVMNCVFSGNSATNAAGMTNNNNSPQIADCHFVSNSAVNSTGAISFAGGSVASVTRCIFSGNTAGDFSGAIYNGTNSVLTVTGCVFSGNSTASDGGGIACNDNSSVTVTNSTFYGNAAGVGDCIHNSASSSTTLVNCVLANGGTDEVYNDGTSSCTAAYSNIQGGYAGPNIDADPLFVDAAGGDLRLKGGSPCIDAGDGDAAPSLDLDGNARHDDPGTVDSGTGAITYADMGAYEFHGSSLRVESPNGTEVLTRGQDWNITWNPTGEGGTVRIEIGHMGTDPVTDPEGAWTGVTDTAGSFCPSPLRQASAVWTGTRMVLFGGVAGAAGTPIGTGAVYDPATNTWESAASTGGLCPSNLCAHSAVWTGSRMIVWGGTNGVASTNTGVIYNPIADSWETTTSTDGLCPTDRYMHAAVWTGSRMIIWAGSGNTGAAYNPATDTWESSTSTTGLCPTSRYSTAGVWTGTRMVVFGGYDTGYTNTGGIYNLATDTWEAETSLGAGLPVGRSVHSMVWTGSRALVYGGAPGGAPALDDGAIYEPVANAWQSAIPGQPFPYGRWGHVGVWTGTRMLVWGGCNGEMTGTEVNTGALYNPPGWHVLTVVAESTPDDGSFTIPASVTKDIWVGDEYRVRITHLLNAQTDDSDADFAISAGGGPGVWHVNSHVAGSGDGKTWLTAMQTPQEAVDAAFASGGGEVWVQAGTYNNGTGGTESVVVMADGVHLYGGFAGWESTRTERVLLPGRRDSVLDGENTAYHVVIGASNATLDGFTVTRGRAVGIWPDPNSCGAGIYSDGVSNLTVASCTFSSNVADADGGGMYNSYTSGLIDGCTFQGNSANGGGIYNWYSSPEITNCLFTANSAPSGGGMYNRTSSPKVTNCTFSGNTATVSGGAMRGYEAYPIITNCILWANAATGGNEISNNTSTPVVSCSDIEGGVNGAGCDGDPSTDAGGNINIDPVFVGGGDYHLDTGSPCVDTGMAYEAPATDIEGTLRPQGGGVDMGAYERASAGVWYVVPGGAGVQDGSSWADAFDDPQDGVAAAAAAGGEVWVAAGTYNNDNVGDGTTTVLTMAAGVGIFGGFKGDETVRSQRDPDANVTKLDGEDTAYHVVEGASNATLDGFTVTRGNANDVPANYVGAGMTASGVSGLEVIGCVFKGNRADYGGGGVYSGESASPLFLGCRFVGNSAGTLSGGIPGHDGGAIYVNDSAAIKLVSCVFLGNTASDDGGGVFLSTNANAEIANCVFTANTSSTVGGGIYCYVANTTLTNSILWGNSPGEIGNFTTTPSVSYSCVQGGYAGPNIDADPLFVDAPGGNLRLRASSPCIDAADGDAAPSTDILGLARFDDPATGDTGTGAITYADMGAYEFQGGITVTSPNDGTEILKRGEPWTVTWDSTCTGGNVRVEIGHMGTDPVVEPEGAWTGTTTITGAPPPKNVATAVWTGTRMLIWAGHEGGPLPSKTGAIYDPAADGWEYPTAIGSSFPQRYSHCAAWTGSHMIVWGGNSGVVSYMDIGHVYDPTADAWVADTSTAGGCPGARGNASAVWTGARMIVWGGQVAGPAHVNTGGMYDPTTDTWDSGTSTAGFCPSVRSAHAAAWTGSHMLVWGGFDGSPLQTGATYNPATDTWEWAISTLGACPSARYGTRGVWTGSRFVVWGGLDGGWVNTGAIYNPPTDTWESPTSVAAGVPSARNWHCAVWTGTRMVVWGGEPLNNTGAFYNPPGWHVQRIVAESTPDDGSFTIPAEVTAKLSVGDEYRVRVIHLPTGTRDDSDADFTIANLDIWRPKAGDVWAVAGAHDIKWQETWCADTLTLEYSISGSSGPWVPITTGVAASDGEYAWTPPPGAVSDSACVRITSEQNPGFVTVSDEFGLASAYRVVDLATGAIEDRPYVPDLLANDEYKTTKLVLKLIEPGAFHMGDESDPPVGDADELPVHYVRITKPYHTGVFELTQAQWEAIMGAKMFAFEGFDYRPAESVSWNDCQDFLVALSTLSGENCRLPTEAEWEYAAKAGTHTNYSYGDAADPDWMWYDANSSATQEVATTTNGANPWGLYDVHGNAWEWCQDWYKSDYYASSLTDDPRGPASGSQPVVRSASWRSPSSPHSRSAFRSSYPPTTQNDDIGFRVVLGPGPRAVTFADKSAGLPAVWYGEVAWGDCDNNGWLDLAVTGRTLPSSPWGHIAEVYLNSSGSFSDGNAGMQVVDLSGVAWGDLDADGDLDICICGSKPSFGGEYCETYVNDGFPFTEQSTSLPLLAFASLTWGDHDNDGDLDLGATGVEGGTRISEVYSNTAGSFAGIGAGLTGVESGLMAWGDFDNDTDLDLVVVGSDVTTSQIASLYRNDNGSYTPVSDELVGVGGYHADWGDYDNDGDLDLLLCGGSGATTFTRLYANTGGTFSEVNVGLPAVAGSLAWGDYDNDGCLDIALTGRDTADAKTTRLLRNAGGQFVDSGFQFANVDVSDVSWADYDNDGDLDLFVTGRDDTDNPASILYENNCPVANTAPAAPSGLSASATASEAMFSWSAATDDETPSLGLTYNLRVGTSPGADDVMPAMADLTTGFRRIPAMGNVQHNLSWKLKNLAPGTYYWSVQAVDTTFAGGAWAPEEQVIIP